MSRAKRYLEQASEIKTNAEILAILSARLHHPSEFRAYW